MNWTGGRLKRHAGTHGNADIKAQRAFFAQAFRHPLTNDLKPRDIPREISSLRSHPDEHQIRHYQYVKDLTPDHERRDAQSHDWRQRIIRSTDASIGPFRAAQKIPSDRSNAKDASEHKTIEHNIPNLGSKTQKNRTSEFVPSPSRDFQAIRKSLLEQPDWLGLSTHRPVYIDFPSQSAMANIGRHRRQFTSNETQDRDRSHTQKFQPEPVKTTGRKRKRPEEDVFSLRDDFENNLLKKRCFRGPKGSHTHSVSKTSADRPHQTQSAQQSCLSDRSSFPPLSTFDQERGSYRLAPDQHQQNDIPEDLISLKDLRGLESFDLVRKRYQASRKHNGIMTPVSSDTAVRHTFNEKLSTDVSPQKKSFHLSPDLSTICKHDTRMVAMSEPGLMFESYHKSPANEHISGVEGSLIEISHEHKDAQRSSSGSPLNLQLLFAPTVSPIFSIGESGTAIKDFALTSSALKGKHELQAPDLEEVASVSHRSFPDLRGGMQQGTPLGYYNKEDAGVHDITTSAYFQPSPTKNPVSSHSPLKQFQLDDRFDLSKLSPNSPARVLRIPRTTQPQSEQVDTLCERTGQYAQTPNQEAVHSPFPSSLMEGNDVSSTIFSTPPRQTVSAFTTRHIASSLSSYNVHSNWKPTARDLL